MHKAYSACLHLRMLHFFAQYFVFWSLTKINFLCFLRSSQQYITRLPVIYDAFLISFSSKLVITLFMPWKLSTLMSENFKAIVKTEQTLLVQVFALLLFYLAPPKIHQSLLIPFSSLLTEVPDSFFPFATYPPPTWAELPSYTLFKLEDGTCSAGFGQYASIPKYHRPF